MKIHELVQILVDFGSTNNFLDSTLATKIHPVLDHTNTLEVVVANGEKLRSTGRCDNVKWSVQGIQLTADFHLLPLKGFDIILGIHWLQTLGPILWDFEKLQMSFNYSGQKLLLHGLK